MARQINASFSGVQMNDARPRAYATESTMQKMTGDQSHVYETLTNQPTPGEAATTVTGIHDHAISDGTNDTGALIRHPLHHNFFGATLLRRDENLTDDNTLFLPLYWNPVYIPPGTDYVSIVLLCGRGENREKRLKRFRIKIYDVDTTVSPVTFTEVISDLKFQNATVSNEFYMSNESGSSLETIFARIGPETKDWSSGGVFLFRIDAWDGASFIQENDSEDYDPVEENEVNSLMILPVKQKPVAAPYQWVESQQTTGSAISTPTDFQPVEADWVQDDRSINSAVLTNSSRNDSLLYEVLTGRPSSNKSVPTHNGHNHANWEPGSTPSRGGTTDLDDVGKDISWNLGTWHYGVMREPQINGDNDYFDIDMIFDDGPGSPVTTPNSVWTGRIVAPTIKDGRVPNPSGGGFLGTENRICTVSDHLVRIPAATDANLNITGITSKINAVVFAAIENPGSGGTGNEITVELQFWDVNRLVSSVTSSQTSFAGERVLLFFEDLELPSSVTGNGDLVRLTVRMEKDRRQEYVGMYGITLFYEA